MNFSTIVDFILNNIDLVIAAALAVISFIVNIILAIAKHDKSKLSDALKSLPEVINFVEVVSKENPMSPDRKKALAFVLIKDKYGSFFDKNLKLFDDAIEAILKTPQSHKEGGKVDVSQKNKTF